MAQMLGKTSTNRRIMAMILTLTRIPSMELDNNVKGSEERAFFHPQVPAEQRPPLTDPNPTGITKDDDEFDDLDDDFLDGAETLIAVVETGLSTQVNVPDSYMEEEGMNVPREKKKVEDEDDSYGDDFGGDFDFEAAELAATQSTAHRMSTTLPHVCTIR